MATHSALPWHVEIHEDDDDKRAMLMRGNSSIPIASVGLAIMEDRGMRNIRFIAQAVNNHYAMRDALNRLLIASELNMDDLEPSTIAAIEYAKMVLAGMEVQQ